MLEEIFCEGCRKASNSKVHILALRTLSEG